MDFILVDLPSLIIKNLSGHILEGTLLILIFFAIFLILLIKNKTLHPNATSLLITIGICFTFYGISKGLANFDTEHIDEDLPQLINGIKTAFLVSVVAVFCAITLKIITLFMEIFTKKEEITDEVDIKDLVSLQNKSFNLTQQNIEILTKNTQLLENLNDNVKLLRIDNEKGFTNLNKNFEDFSKTLAENNSKAFIKALEEVIKDFNIKITEQFGDNFKQLNLAVGSLLEWQENYKNFVQQNENTLSNIANILDENSKNYAQVVDNSKEFSEYAKDLNETLKAALSQREALENNIMNLAKFLKDLQENLSGLMEKISLYQEESLKTLNNLSLNSKALEEHYIDSNSKLIQNVDINITKFNDVLTQYNTQIQTQVTDMINQTSSQLTQTLTDSSSKINSQIEVLDKELENILKNLSTNLAGISNRFVQDYQLIIDDIDRLKRDNLAANSSFKGGNSHK